MMTTERPTRTLTLVAPVAGASAHEFASRSCSTLSSQQVLQTVEAVALTTLLDSWQALNLDNYFGQAAAEVRFKEMLLPFVWVARQQLIARVGAAYQSIPMTARANLERELLATLDALCQQGLRTSQSPLDQRELEDAVEYYSRRGWRVFCWTHPDLAEELAETLVAWVNSVARLLQGTSRF
ncbi:MAG: hypothetical protein ICV62_02120 [Cyanobacteria bacterium Co-bin13]|nr:hypothetical protein [Cyanobacteria bacterium Co-bin13]